MTRDQFEQFVRSGGVDTVANKYLELVVQNVNWNRANIGRAPSRNPLHWVENLFALRFIQKNRPEVARLISRKPVMRNG